jgi:hypothetical protein
MQREERKALLANETESMEETAAHKRALDNDVAVLRITKAELQAKTNSQTRRLEVLDAFLGLVRATKQDDLLAFARSLPAVLEESHEKEYSTNLLLKFIIQQLSGKAADGLSCGRCGADFAVNRQSTRTIGYVCPACGSYDVSTNVDLCDVLKEQLYPSDEKSDNASMPVVIRAQPIRSAD